MVEVLTLPNGLSAEEVEKLVTVPLEFGLAGMRDLRVDALDLAVRAVRHSLLLSWDSDYYWDRIETINRLDVRHAAAGHHAPESRRKIRSAKSIATRSRVPITI